MPKRELPSPELLRKLLRYEPETGKLFWKKRDISLFAGDERVFNSWNSRYAGKEAFTSNVSLGYKCGRVFSGSHRAHRVIWALFYGKWPDGDIDHINGKPADNRITNLRIVDASLNQRNTKRRNDNTSGVTGVRWYRALNKWTAQITVRGNKMYLGYFQTKDEAISARKAAEKKYRFHPNHGRSD